MKHSGNFLTFNSVDFFFALKCDLLTSNVCTCHFLTGSIDSARYYSPSNIRASAEGIFLTLIQILYLIIIRPRFSGERLR